MNMLSHALTTLLLSSAIACGPSDGDPPNMDGSGGTDGGGGADTEDGGSGNVGQGAAGTAGSMSNPSTGCDGTDDCLHTEGTHDGNAFELTCTGGETAFDPVSPTSPILPDAVTYDAVCADSTYTIHVSVFADSPDLIELGTYDYDDPRVHVSDGVGIVLQVTENPASQMSEASPNFELASLTISAHEPNALVAGTFSGSWADDFTVDIHAGDDKHNCLEWEGTDCDTGLGQPVPTDCTCVNAVPLFAGEVTGSFHWTFE